MKKIFLFLIASLFLFTACTDGSDNESIVFQTTDLNGNEVTQDIFAEKDLTMINIWATYCPPCLVEMPDLGELAIEYADSMNIVGLVTDVYNNRGEFSEDQIALAKEIVDLTQANYLHILPSDELNASLLSKITAVPTTVFVDASGNITGKTIIGARSKEQWEEIIQENLEIIQNDHAV